MNTPRNLLSLATLGTLLVVQIPCSYAQVAGATLSGIITDPAGLVVPGAKIDILRESTGITHATESNTTGNYVVPNLNPGTYSVTVSASGFATMVEKGIVLEVGSNEQVNFSLQIGTSSQQIQVTIEQPALDLASSSITDVINGAEVRQLPLNGRDWTQLATLQPGVSLIRLEKTVAVGADRGNRGYGAQMTVAGGRPQQNNYRMDGISINDYSNGAPGSVIGLNLGVDAIQEFSVVTANASAEYGREAGGVINAVTRAGTNQFHGSVYEFFRNDALDARNYFDGKVIPPLRQNQFGVAVGGPILKSKTFFFFDYEGLRRSLGSTAIDNVPSLQARAGNVHSPITGLPVTIAVTPDAKKYLGFYPAPNGALLGNGDTAIYTFVNKAITPENFYTARVDQTFSQHDSFHATYFYDSANFTQPDSLNNYLLLSHTNRQLGMFEETHIFSPSLVNSFRAGVSRNVANITNTEPGSNPLAADTTLGSVPGTTASSVVITGLTTFGGGLNAPSQYNFYWTSIQAYDDAFYTHGNHTIRFGGAFENMHNNIVATSSPAGLWTFASTFNFLTNLPQNFSAELPGSNSERGLRQVLGAGYILDDWKALPNLTFNLGVRYEATTVPTEAHGYLSTLLNLTDTTPHLGSPYFSNPTLKNIEPRVGLVFDPFKKGRTSIRAGYGIFDVLPLLYQFELLSSLAAPYLEVGSVTTPATLIGTFAHGGAFSQISASPTSLRQTYIQPHPPRDYLMEWNANIQQDLGAGVTLLVGFVGSRGVHQPFRSDDVNSVQPINPAALPLVFPTPTLANPTVKLNPNVGQIAGLFWTNDTYYDGLLAQVNARTKFGLQGQVSYTYSKSIDGGTATLAGDPFGNSISTLFYFAPQTRRGVADFNVPQSLIVTASYNVPSLKHLNGPVSNATNGWVIGGIFTAQNGLPFTPTIAGDALGLKNTNPYDVPNRLNTTGCKSAVNPSTPLAYFKLQCFAFPAPFTLGNIQRNSLSGPNLFNLDASFLKNTPIKKISEAFNLQFRAELFNILNHANFAPPSANKTIFTVTGLPVNGAGQITSTVTTSRQIQFGLKVIF